VPRRNRRRDLPSIGRRTITLDNAHAAPLAHASWRGPWPIPPAQILPTLYGNGRAPAPRIHFRNLKRSLLGLDNHKQNKAWDTYGHRLEIPSGRSARRAPPVDVITRRQDFFLALPLPHPRPAYQLLRYPALVARRKTYDVWKRAGKSHPDPSQPARRTRRGFPLGRPVGLRRFLRPDRGGKSNFHSTQHSPRAPWSDRPRAGRTRSMHLSTMGGHPSARGGPTFLSPIQPTKYFTAGRCFMVLRRPYPASLSLLEEAASRVHRRRLE